MSTLQQMTHPEWLAEAERRFGPDSHTWKFQCPVCARIQTAEDFRPYSDRGATPESVTCECIGRYKPLNPPCNYSGYGLFKLSPVRIVVEDGTELHCFGFAPEDTTA